MLLIITTGMCIAVGQMLDNTEGKTFGETPYFNEAFVKRNKIKTLKGYFSTKATMDYIRKSKDVYYYEFNEAGQLIKDYRTQYKDTFVCLLYTSPSPRDRTRSRMPSSA